MTSGNTLMIMTRNFSISTTMTNGSVSAMLVITTAVTRRNAFDLMISNGVVVDCGRTVVERGVRVKVRLPLPASSWVVIDVVLVLPSVDLL